VDSLVAEVGGLLARQRMTLGVVESATGGLLSHLITGVPGISAVYRGSVTAYANEVKVGVVGVSADTLERWGAVSQETAGEMACGGQRLLGVDICLADTGIAGPGGGSAEKPVGLFYIALAGPSGVEVRRYHFEGDREENKAQAAKTALLWLREYLLGLG